MRTKLSLAWLVILALASVGLMSTSVGPAAASTTSGGTVHVFAYGDGEGLGTTILLTGAIADSGWGVGVDANGTVDPTNNTEVNLALVHGSFRINIQALVKKIDKAFGNFQPDTSTCSGYVSATAPAPVVTGSGTGAYSGISGALNLTLTIADIGAKYASGKHKGQCNESNNSPTIGQAQLVTGSGTVSF